MKLKTFRAATMAETLAKVKQEFGSEAVILSTRTISKSKVLGIGGGEEVEITAARDVSDLPPAVQPRPRPPQQRQPRPPRGNAAEATPGTQPPVRPPANPPGRPPARPPAGTLRETPAGRPSIPQADARPATELRTPPALPETLLSEVGELKSLVNNLVQRQQTEEVRNLPKGLLDTYQKLVGNAVAERMAERLVRRVQENLGTGAPTTANVRKQLATSLETILPPAAPIKMSTAKKSRVVALVGPTGVGKTTTIAKLAANLCLREQKKVGLVTIDTYRIAAAEQLRTYAQIIDLPLVVASTPQQLADAVNTMADRDVVLIDTAGRSQRDDSRINELCAYFSRVKPDEVHLVLSSTASKATLEQIIRKFRVVQVDRVIFTKLDEAVGFGVLLDCLELAEAALSYVTTGQDVPNDIEPGEAGRLVELLLSGQLRPGSANQSREMSA